MLFMNPHLPVSSNINPPGEIAAKEPELTFDQVILDENSSLRYELRNILPISTKLFISLPLSSQFRTTSWFPYRYIILHRCDMETILPHSVQHLLTYLAPTWSDTLHANALKCWVVTGGQPGTQQMVSEIGGQYRMLSRTRRDPIRNWITGNFFEVFLPKLEATVCTVSK